MKNIVCGFSRGGLCCVILLVTLLAPQIRAETVLITGANSGIGLEFATQYAADGWEVIATHRRITVPDSLATLAARYANVRIERIDVTDASSIERVSNSMAEKPIDVLINNAGVIGDMDDATLHFGTLDYDRLLQFMDVNAAGPLRIAEAFYTNVMASGQKKIVAISSVVGSANIVKNGLRTGLPLLSRYPYNMSKAALNMAYVHLASDAAADGVAVAVLHPGLVRVARTANYQMPEQLRAQVIEVEESVRSLRRRISELTLESSGSFISYSGEQLPL